MFDDERNDDQFFRLKMHKVCSAANIMPMMVLLLYAIIVFDSEKKKKYIQTTTTTKKLKMRLSKEALLSLLLASSCLVLPSSNAFVPSSSSASRRFGVVALKQTTATITEPVKVVKPTGTSFLPEETVERAKNGSPIEKIKLEKDGTSAFVDVYEYARKIREGEMTWEEVEKADLDTRLKWVGMLHRGKRTPGQFMMRLKVPNGIVNSDQMRFYADCVEKYGEELGVVDITTRANIQLRGVKLEDAADVIDGLHARNQTTIQSALDNVRNMVGSPLAGIDDKEMVDTREICNALNDLVSLDPVTGTRGNPYW